MGLTVTDLDTSIAFYRDVIGMVPDPIIDLGRSESFDALTSNPGTRTRLCFLTTPVGGTGGDRRPAAGTFTLQLWEYETGGGAPVRPAHNRIGSAHLAFFVEDARAAFRELTERDDVTVTGPLVERDTSVSFYIADPDGIPVELWEEFPVAVDDPAS
jgi:catechol 2,3-dioxygenase-like lactoylglutathione lyase family enzyme